jgi:hypothetical protein
MEGYLMSTTYSRKQIEKKLLSWGLANLYKAAFIQYKGNLSKNEGSVPYSEILAEKIIEDGILKKIEADIQERLPRYQNFNQQHNGLVDGNNPCEKTFAIALKNMEEVKVNAGGTIEKFTILDYQIPLKEKMHNDPRGEIDLVAVDAKGSLCLIELKPPKCEETLLRAALEIFTYFSEIDGNTEKKRQGKEFIDDFRKTSPQIQEASSFRKIVLVGRTSWAGKTATKLKKLTAQKLLYSKMGIEIFVYDASNLDPLKFPQVEGKLKPTWDADFPIERVFPT